MSTFSILLLCLSGGAGLQILHFVSVFVWLVHLSLYRIRRVVKVSESKRGRPASESATPRHQEPVRQSLPASAQYAAISIGPRLGGSVPQPSQPRIILRQERPEGHRS